MTVDRIYSEKLIEIPPFSFDRSVAEVFDDMVNRSIPFYSELQELLCFISCSYYQPGTSIIDLGCSTGETLFRLNHHLPTCQYLLGVDSSPEMIEKAKVKCKNLSNIELLCQDIREINLHQNPSIILITFVLQFLPPLTRKAFLIRCYEALPKDGILLLSEKLAFEHFQEVSTQFHNSFKTKNHYSELEIQQKRTALENVLTPFTMPENIKLLESAGFSGVESVFQFMNFGCLLARK